MRLVSALMAVALGSVLFTSDHFFVGAAFMVLGLMLVRRPELDRTRIALRRGHSHGFGECSGEDCRL